MHDVRNRLRRCDLFVLLAHCGLLLSHSTEEIQVLAVTDASLTIAKHVKVI